MTTSSAEISKRTTLFSSFKLLNHRLNNNNRRKHRCLIQWLLTLCHSQANHSLVSSHSSRQLMVDMVCHRAMDSLKPMGSPHKPKLTDSPHTVNNHRDTVSQQLPVTGNLRDMDSPHKPKPTDSPHTVSNHKATVSRSSHSSHSSPRVGECKATAPSPCSSLCKVMDSNLNSRRQLATACRPSSNNSGVCHLRDTANSRQGEQALSEPSCSGWVGAQRATPKGGEKKEVKRSSMNTIV